MPPTRFYTRDAKEVAIDVSRHVVYALATGAAYELPR
jgi:hypothetical protein